jgi:hypothetical protein
MRRFDAPNLTGTVGSGLLYPQALHTPRKGRAMIYDLTNAQFVRMLRNFSAILDKAAQYAETKKFDVGVLLQSRLAPDQFNFIRQVQIMCDTAKKGAAQLTGKEPPVHPDTEQTLPEVRARIESVISYLEKFAPTDYAGAEERRISQPRWEGQYLTGKEFATHHLIPNFYFHFATGYSILRHNGVDVGKKDYLGKMPFKK